ncbi:MAG: hypothetical protein UT02_C0002G0030 [Parcubacteria group bacterium GW2011_GWC2_38_7]|nr:MAG: hypothetical protein UT02_C0002G0030 [Parcubacteria group bacterium GW2011_GWC2_38_7]
MDNNKQEEIILLKDKEWSLIDGDLCLVTTFTPLDGNFVKDGIVTSSNTLAPYAAIEITCRTATKITGFITHKIDFANLWHVFKEINFNPEKEEVQIYWTTKHYNNLIAKIISFLYLTFIGMTPLPKMFVMLYKKGTFDKLQSENQFSTGNNLKLPPKSNAQVFIYGSIPISFWMPDIMKE